ncbi:hypothetical protein CR105_19260 [Massilia eurypsychrophila]|uniref:Transmembrane protein n=1 Tax=Massilia eurypsychrophila TaxID=1485217 RepID=A0A2G8TBN3_9BURK|nr:hypothetical protein [Massilia eurypsychrophila]PIL43455.1 hypothetical protein CR105_19260 [Massilia eurypsychrophila]
MKSSRTLRNRLLSPLVYLAALLLLLEDWLWDLGLRLVRLVAAWPPWKALERHIIALPPYAALAAFVLPAILLLPVKLVALFAIASGYPMSGISVIILAKVGGAAVVARLYVLTKPTLLSLPWFALWHEKFMTFKSYWIGRLKATDAFRRVSMLSQMMRGAARAALARLRPKAGFGARHASRPARMLRRFIAIWRARRR